MSLTYKTTLLAFFLLCSLCLAAEEAPRDTVRIWKTDGTSEMFLLPARPGLTFTERDIVFTTPVLTLDYPLSSCSAFTLERHGDGTGTDGEAGNDGTVFSLTGGGLSVTGLKPRSAVTVRDMEGRRLLKRKTDRNGSLNMQMPAAGGTFWVETGSSTFRVSIP